MVRQLSPAPLSSSSGSGSGSGGSGSGHEPPDASAADTWDELQEAESSDEELGIDATASRRHEQHASGSAAFAATCAAQLQKPGLLGALVAAAYADRIAQLKPGSGSSRPSYSLSNGERARAWCARAQQAGAPWAPHCLPRAAGPAQAAAAWCPPCAPPQLQARARRARLRCCPAAQAAWRR
jgi:hypothetical protein